MKKLFLVISLIIIAVNVFCDEKKVSQSMTNGIYMDCNKQYHSWGIKENHTLLWNEHKFMPCGFRVCFKSLEDKENTEIYPEDINTVNMLAANGINSIIISNNNQFTLSNPQTLNKIIELLEKNNITYGIDLNEESINPLKGFIINPTKYRIDGPYPENEIITMWEEVDSGIFTVTNKITGEIIEKGALAKSNNGQIIIRLKKNLTSNESLIVYPHLTYFTNFDLWQGYNEIRDNILAYFKQVNLGKGFRFFSNPFNLDKLCSVTDQPDFIPTSSGFNLSFETYLTKNYFHAPSLANSWTITKDDTLVNISDFLKIFPLWHNRRGIPYMYSLVTGEKINADTNYSTYWQDLNLMKFMSVQDYMNSISISIRENIANVPIVFSSSHVTQTFTVPYDKGSCDGFSYNFSSLDIADCNSMALLYTYSQINPKTTCLFGISSSNQLSAEDIDFLSHSGYRGFFIDYDPKLIPNLKKLTEEMSDFSPEGIPFPTALPLNAQRLDDETLWYPSNDVYSIRKFGDNIIGYQKQKSDQAVLFTLKGTQKITVVGSGSKDCKILYPKDKSIKKGKKAINSHEYTFEITTTPTLVSNLDINKTCPKQAVEEMMNKYETFIKESDLDENNKTLMKKNLKEINDVYKKSSYKNAYGMCAEKINKFLFLTGADIWMETENFPRTTFTDRKIIPEASANAVVVLDTDKDPKFGAYYVSANISIPTNKSYILWVAASKPEISDSFEISYDNNPYMAVKTDRVIPYTDELAWYRVGPINLNAGSHSIDIRCIKNNSNPRYYLALDAIYLTDSDRQPKGTDKPKLVITDMETL